ncbi:unnamed protein product [Staurois parvus]|uniref:Uncharacterized protein n=1 Tax=Staurois parvus TaxID=386267 RepID=A0ABN9DPT0_9NEOB|nr:unnamed protein product [Staurois parvus]
MKSFSKVRTTSRVSNWRPSSCCQTTSPMRHCKTDSYKHDSQRQRHDGTCSFATAGGPPAAEA